jgi:mRNA-degrading endonuclease RelE of RelBE toxin-antitoxin system
MRVVFIETLAFSKHVHDYMDDDEYAEFQAYLAENPTEGSVIPHTGGLRKIRWAVMGKGKRGGARIIYYNRLASGKIWLITIYTKNEFENISDKGLKILRNEVSDE